MLKMIPLFRSKRACAFQIFTTVTLLASACGKLEPKQNDDYVNKVENNFVESYGSYFNEPRLEKFPERTEVIRVWRSLPSGISTVCLTLTMADSQNQFEAKLSKRIDRTRTLTSERKLSADETKKIFSIIRANKFWESNRSPDIRWQLQTGNTLYLVEALSQGKRHRLSDNLVCPKIGNEILAVFDKN